MRHDYRINVKDGYDEEALEQLVPAEAPSPRSAAREREVATGPTTAVGVFEDRRHARIAVDELVRNGFSLEQIGFVMPEERPLVDPPHVDHPSRTPEGAAAGAAAGGTLGGLVGAALATAFIPGVGPVLAGGVLAAGVAGAAFGLAGGGLLGALLGMSVPEEDARVYEEAFHSGRTIVTVHAGDRHDEAVAILRRAESAPEQEIHAHPGRHHVVDDGTVTPGTGSVFVD
jgi:hypothetical protein